MKIGSREFGIVTAALLVLLALRFLAQLFGIFVSEQAVISIIFAMLYLASIGGILGRQKWGFALSIIVPVIDIATRFFMMAADPPAVLAGSLITDILIIILAFWELKQIHANRPRKFRFRN